MAALACCSLFAVGASAESRETVTIRGRSQSLHVYGARGGTPFIVSSGDGGWIQLGPHVAEMLAGLIETTAFIARASLKSASYGCGALRTTVRRDSFSVKKSTALAGGERGDERLSGQDVGLDAADQLRALQPEIKVIFLTQNREPRYAVEAFRRKASGYLLKDSAASELTTAIREVRRARPVRQ